MGRHFNSSWNASSFLLGSDANGKTTQFGYDNLGRLTTVTDALNQVTSYGYDEVGNRLTQTDANNHTTSYQYDQRGRRTGRTLPLGQSESYTYDANGNLATKTDFNGKTTTYAYDGMNQLLSKTPDPSFGAPPVTFTYIRGQRFGMTDASGGTSYFYSSGRVTQLFEPAGQINYAYDLADNVTRINAAGLNVNYTYDALNRLSTVQESNTGTTSYAYDNVGNLQSVTYPNGVVHTYSYDTRNRLTNLGVAKGANSLLSYAYTLDAAGHRTNVTEQSGRTVNYNYDNLYRLTNETVALDPASINGAVNYTYDAVGNRKQMASTLPGVVAGLWNYDANDRFTAGDTYDANGNTTSSGGITAAYDFENRLIQKGGVTIVYDGDGNRVAKTVAGVTTRYLVDVKNPTGYAQVIAEEFSNGLNQGAYVYGLDRISKAFYSTQFAGPQGFRYYLYDGHGSVRALADTSGNVTDTYDYDAFGNLIHSTFTSVPPLGNSVSPSPNNYLYSGEQFDPDLNLYYNRARYLNVSTGRFWTMDAFEGVGTDPFSLHRYLYASDEPVGGVDPGGNLDFSIAGVSVSLSVNQVIQSAALGALVGGVDKLLEGGSASDVAKAALQGAAIGAVTAPLLGIKYLGVALAGTGLGFSVVGAVKATLDNNYKLAAFRALLFFAGSIAVLRAGVPSAAATEAAQGQDGTLARLIDAAGQALDQNGPGSGPVYGTDVHTSFANIVKSWGDPNLSTEISYLNGEVVTRGTAGSVRVDVVEGPIKAPTAIYDLKTGSAELTLARVQQLQTHVPGGKNLPVIEVRGGAQQ